MTAFIIRRLIQGIFVLLVVSVLIFSVMRLLPGDPLKLYVAQNQLEKITSDDMEKLKHEFGLDKSIPLQYINWIIGSVRGNLGKSILLQGKVSTLLANVACNV
jgi:peptide/nickel transport system permease protein